MSLRVLSCRLLSIQIWLIFSEARATDTIYHGLQGRKLTEEAVLQRLDLRSKVECTVACSSHAACESFSWGANDKQCLLSGNERLKRKFLETAEHWVTMAKQIYPVEYYEGDGGRYSMTFEQAWHFCADLNTTLASPALLLQARATGYEQCNCGWLSDGTIGFVLQHADSECWSSFSTGILYCGHTGADVYCQFW